MSWRDLRGRVLHANGKHLSDRQIEDIIRECDLIESIERKWDADSMGVAPYHRVILKKRVSLLRDGATEGVWRLFKKYNLNASIQLHPARLMDYYLPYSERGMIVSTPLTAEDVKKFEEHPYVLFIDGDHKIGYVVGLKVDDNQADGIVDVLRNIRNDINLIKLDKASAVNNH